MSDAVIIESTETLCIECASGVALGDFAKLGTYIVGMALRDRDSNNYTTIKIPRTYVARKAVQGLSLVGSAGSASAVSAGDKLYWDATNEVVSKDTAGVFIGYALGTKNSTTGGYPSGTAVAAGATTTIDILAAFIGS
jgi:hypothetical protein